MNRIQFVLENLNGRILDAGFSVGRIHEAIKKKFNEKNVFAIDIVFRWKVKGNYVLGNVELMPFKAKTFDSIFAGELIEHLNNPNKFLIEASRVLKDNGLIILTTPNKKSLINRLFHSYEKQAHLSLFSINELKELLEKNNFKIKKFFCLPYTEESSEGSKFKVFFPLRKLMHYLLPKSLQEDIIILAERC
jgi:ubiquinone/menaquinone biosynthesis C-methylase UbiE